MSTFRMPSLGADMEEGKLVEWLVSPGDEVAHGDVVAVVETQKGAIEIEIFEPAVIDELLASEGETLPVGAPLARTHTPGEEPDEVPDDAPETQVAPATPPRQPDPAKPADAPPARTEPVRKPATAAPRQSDDAPPPASPAARALAREAGVDLGAIAGTGPGGAVLLSDVEARIEAACGEPEDTAAEKRAPATESETPPERPRPGKPGLDMAAMRQAISAAMSRAKREIPHYYLERTIDLQPATDWLAERNAVRDPAERLLMGALFLRAAALAATQVPELNGHYVDGEFRPSEAVHAGLAVAMRGGGLIAPAIRDAQDLGLDALMAAIRDMVARTRNGRLRNSEVTQGTITVSSMGEGGADALYAVIYPPQVAILGFGAPVRRPWVVGDAVEPRTTVTVTLSADHRVSDGRRGARLLGEIERLLKEPETL
jgi:pyruvate dehydrogenase E2 component (dihydrolipoamide acetyltransferase)